MGIAFRELQHCNKCNSESGAKLAWALPSACTCRRSQHYNSESGAIRPRPSATPSILEGELVTLHCLSSLTTDVFYSPSKIRGGRGR